MSTAPDQQPSLADRLKDVRVGVRQDLEVSRHMFRGEPAYVVRDPVTFRSHRFDAADYQLLARLDAGRTLQETFDDLVARDLIAADEQEAFYDFVLTLHRLSFLNLPIANHGLLFKRYQAKQRARRRAKIVGAMFMQIPLVNPDAFLSRTVGLARWLYSGPAFVVWLMVMLAAGYVAAQNTAALAEPLNGLLATHNLVIMWLTLIILKIFHEFGHAYACKHYGGHVPEMGVYLIMGTPCAYVDATTAWGFSSKRQRLVVSLGGMYIETFIAALALFVWAAWEPGLIKSIAYNVALLASAVTILFNINPLMRYDGYYIASDLLEIPNLRQRATQQVTSTLKRLVLGVRDTAAPVNWRLKTTLLGFGAAATLYRTTVMLAIAGLIATKFFYLGLGLAVLFIGSLLYGLLKKLVSYLWFAEETAAVRGRAIAVSVVVLLLVPTGIGWLPVPGRVVVDGVVTAEQEAVIRAKTPGFVMPADVRTGDHVVVGAPLMQLDNPVQQEHILSADAALQAGQMRQRALESEDPTAAQQQAQRNRTLAAELEHARAAERDLTLVAPHSGRVVDVIGRRDVGRFVRAGDPLVTVVAGAWELHVVLTAEQFAAVGPAVGDRVTVRLRSDTVQSLGGEVIRVEPAATHHIAHEALTFAAGGDVVVDAASAESVEPYVALTVRLADDAAQDVIRHGQTGKACFVAEPEPIGRRIYRRLVRFTDSLVQS